MPLDLSPLLKAFPGRVGVYAHHLDLHETFSHHADDVMPTASAAKVFILMRYAQLCVEGQARSRHASHRERRKTWCTARACCASAGPASRPRSPISPIS